MSVRIFEDFENGAPGFSDDRTEDGGSFFTRFLGRFGFAESGTVATERTFDTSGATGPTTISFDFYELDDWDPGDTLDISLNGEAIFSEDFADVVNDPSVSGTVTTTFGNVTFLIEPISEPIAGLSTPDFSQIHRVTLVIQDPIDSVTLGVGGTFTATGEEIGIDNLVVSRGPNAEDDAITVSQSETNGDVDLDVLDNDILLSQRVTAVDGDAANVAQIVAGSNGGTFRIAPDGRVDFSANGEFDFLGQGDTATTSVTYQVTGAEFISPGVQQVSTTGVVGGGDRTADFSFLTAQNTSNGTTPIEGDITFSQFTTLSLNVIFVVDVSGSTGAQFNGAAVGDVNGDGASNTILDAQIAALQDLSAEIAAFGFDNNNVNIGVVSYSTNAAFEGEFDAGSAALDAELETFRAGGRTDFDDGLELAFTALTSIGATNADSNVVFFLSDGVHNEGPTQDIVNARVALENSFNASVIGVGVGNGTSLAQLNLVDNTGGAEIVNTTDSLDEALEVEILFGVDIADFRVFIDGVQVSGIDVNDLIPNGQNFTIDPQVIAGLTNQLDSGSVVRAEAEFTDGTVLTNQVTINTAPSVTDTATVTVTITGENDAPDAIDDTVDVDEDVAQIISVLANDVDVDGDTLTISAVTDGTNGTVVDNGDGTVTYTPDADFNGTDTFTYTVSDGNGGTDTATVTVTVNPVNDAPVAADDAPETDEDTPVVVSVLANDSDVDGDTLTISAVTDGTNGTVVDNGDGTVTYTPDADFNGTDTFTYTVSDGNGGNDTATVTVTVNPVNDAPVAADDTPETDEDTPVVVSVLANDSDVDGDTLTISAVTDGTNGTVTDNGDGTVTYTPDTDFNGTDTFTYTVSDGNGGTDTATVTVTVNPVNDAPVAADDTPETDEDTPVVVSVLANDSDVDGDTLTISAFGQGSNGTVTDNGDGTVTYTPDADFNGTDSFTYTVSDGNGGTDTATVNVTVNPVNDAPVAADDAPETDEDTPVVVSVLANDSDVDGDTLTISAVTDGTNGTVVDNGDGTVTYTPDADFNGTDTFTYTVSDGNGGNDTATVTVTVNPVNDAPVAADDTPETDEDTPVVVSVLANDSDVDGDTLTISAVTDGTNGTVTDNGDGTVTYTPDTDFNGTDTFTYTVSDGNGGTDTATVTVTVNPVNDAPVAEDDSPTTDQDTAVIVSVLDNDSDIDGDTLTISAFGQGTNGTVTDNGDGTLTYAPDAGFDGTDSFTYTISDGNGGTDTATVNVTVNSTNTAPDAVYDSFLTRGGEAAILDLLLNDSDPENDTLTISTLGDPGRGQVVDNGDGTVTYTPNAGFFSTDSFTYTISDGNGGFDTATVNITQNFAPIIPEPVVLRPDENQTFAGRVAAFDFEGDDIDFSIAGGADALLFRIDEDTGDLFFENAPDFENPLAQDQTINGGNTYFLNVTATDPFASATAQIEVVVQDVDDNPNEAPVITTPTTPFFDPNAASFFLTAESIGVVGTINAVDPNGDDLEFRIFGEDIDKFDIDIDTGEITLLENQTQGNASFDNDAIFELDVQVTDSAGETDTLAVELVLFLSA